MSRVDDRAAESLPAQVEALERRLIAEAMRETAGVQASAARRLGLTPRQLGYKLRKYGMVGDGDSA